MGKGDNKSPPAQKKRSHRDSLLILTCWLLRDFSDQCGDIRLGDGPKPPPPAPPIWTYFYYANFI